MSIVIKAFFKYNFGRKVKTFHKSTNVNSGSEGIYFIVGLLIAFLLPAWLIQGWLSDPAQFIVNFSNAQQILLLSFFLFMWLACVWLLFNSIQAFKVLMKLDKKGILRKKIKYDLFTYYDSDL